VSKRRDRKRSRGVFKKGLRCKRKKDGLIKKEGKKLIAFRAKLHVNGS